MMVPFFNVCLELARVETRTLLIRNNPCLPDGDYGFIEHYCEDLECDCRRVLIVVWTPRTDDRAWATIDYGWESPEFYRKWDRHSEEDMKGSFLDPLGGQSPYAHVLLAYFAQNPPPGRSLCGAPEETL